MGNVSVVLNQVCIFFIIIIVGFAATKLKLLQKEQVAALAKVVTNTILPFVVFVNIVGVVSRDQLLGAWYVLVADACVYIVLIPLAFIVAKLARLKTDRSRALQMNTIFGNVAFFGIPMTLAVFGQAGMFYIALLTMLDLLLIWTYGVWLCTPPSGERFRFSVSNLKNIITPPLVAIVTGIILVVTGITLPDIVMTAFRTISSASTPLPFIYIGGMLALTNWKEFLDYKEIGLIILVKMFAFPILVNFVLKLIGLPEVVIGVFTVITGLPTIVISPMLARRFGSDDKPYMAAVVVTTVASLVTMPLVSYLTSFF